MSLSKSLCALSCHVGCLRALSIPEKEFGSILSNMIYLLTGSNACSNSLATCNCSYADCSMLMRPLPLNDTKPLGKTVNICCMRLKGVTLMD